VSLKSGLLSPAIAVSDYATAVDNNVPLCHAPTIQLSNVTFATGRPTQSLLHLFGGTARVTLHVHAGTTTQVVSPTDCSSGYGTTDNVYEPADGDPVIPISFDATFKISPSVTADGKLRLGILTVPAGSTQPSTFARITMCVNDATTCDTRAFPSRLKVLQLNAEVLVGDIFA
jgi:hypothetical protein